MHIYKTLKYLDKTKNINNISHLDLTKKDIIKMYGQEKYKYINKQQIGGDPGIDFTGGKIFMSNFHGSIDGSKSFTVPENTYVIVPNGVGFINYVNIKEKVFFKKTNEELITVLTSVDPTDNVLMINGKNYYILEPNKNYCDIKINLLFDLLIDEGLYFIDDVQPKINSNLFYRDYYWGDAYPNKSSTSYFKDFNIVPLDRQLLKILNNTWQVSGAWLCAGVL